MKKDKKPRKKKKADKQDEKDKEKDKEKDEKKTEKPDPIEETQVPPTPIWLIPNILIQFLHQFLLNFSFESIKFNGIQSL